MTCNKMKTCKTCRWYYEEDRPADDLPEQAKCPPKPKAPKQEKPKEPDWTERFNEPVRSAVTDWLKYKQERRNRYLGAQLKKKCETVVMHAARQLGNVEFEEPVYMIYHWYEKDRRRDKDNICAFGRKGYSGCAGESAVSVERRMEEHSRV